MEFKIFANDFEKMPRVGRLSFDTSSCLALFFRCDAIDEKWYLGDDCNLPIVKVALYAGLSVTLGVLLLTVGALAAYLVVNKQKQNR
ncbi:hypothetical protein NHX12_013585 [Muraenolepis orangiensis]|uniref:Uncharacterized protein n=1 Tax=Muraenolepis orangiensis TaxID=630683 RepID=A0A9Q0I2X5_9TELE|nr:hypothetical protein NHX12_013585 [Muraenolepis orangiensis]